MKKLTPAQQLVIDRMANGWELGCDSTFRGGWRMQQGGLGEGGEYARVHASTAVSLKYQGLIESPTRGFPVRTYTLTQAGKDAASKPQKGGAVEKLLTRVGKLEKGHGDG